MMGYKRGASFSKEHSKTHGEIISHLFDDTNNIYCLTGFKHKELMQNLEINHLIFYDDKSISFLKWVDFVTFKATLLKNRTIIYLTSNCEEYLNIAKSLKLSKTAYKRFKCIDIEVLKAICLIPQDELKQNDFQIGLSVGGNGTFKALFDELKVSWVLMIKRLITSSMKP